VDEETRIHENETAGSPPYGAGLQHQNVNGRTEGTGQPVRTLGRDRRPAAVAAVSAGRQRRVAPMPVKVPAEGRVEVEDLVRCQDYDYEETTARAMFGLY